MNCELPELGRLNFGNSENLDGVRTTLGEGDFLSANDFSAQGVYAEHDTALPKPCCNGPLCVHAELGVVPDLSTGEPLRVVRVGVNVSDRSAEQIDVRRNVVITVDLSASLRSPESVDLIKTLIDGFIQGLHPEDKLAIITFRNQPKLDVPLTEVGTDRSQFSEAVDALEFGGATNLWGGLEGALFHAVSNFEPDRENRVILLTDGRPTWGTSNVAQIVDETYGFVRHGLMLSIVGVGEEQVDTITRTVGTTADGLFFSLTSEDEVEAFVASELETTWRAVAQNFALEITKTGPFQAEAAGLALGEWDGERARIERPVILEAADGRLRAPGHGLGGGSMVTFTLDGGDVAGEQLFTTRLTYRKGGEDFRDSRTVTPDFDTANLDRDVHFDSPEMEFATLVHDVARLTLRGGYQRDARAFESSLDALILARARVQGFQAVHGERPDLQRMLGVLNDAIGNLERAGWTPTSAPPAEGWPTDEPATNR